MKQVKIQGFSEDVAPDSKPAVAVFGQENVGTTRFGCTAPHEEGYIGWLALDRNSRQTVEEMKQHHSLPILINKEPFLSHREAMTIALVDSTDKVREIYTEVVKRIFDAAMKLADHPDVESIAIDRASQVFDAILFSHFGRRNQIESYQRGAPNQDMVDLINALSKKNLVLICKATEVWADTGEVDKMGKKKQAPTGKFKPDGFGQIGRFVTAVVELTAARKKYDDEDEEEALRKKYKLKVVTCKGQTLLEGSELSSYGVCGQDITWDNLMAVIGVR